LKLRTVELKKPTVTVNDEGGREIGHATEITTKAKVVEVKQTRDTEGHVTSLTGVKDFIIRWSSARAVIDKDWKVGYNGKDYTISEVGNVNEDKQFIKIRANG
jgi:SPP1 family predicted phage head-tail adaptor